MAKSSCPFQVEKLSSQQVTSTVSFTSQRSFFRQLMALTYREMLSVRRDTTALGMRFGSSAFLSILFGIIFLNAGCKHRYHLLYINTNPGKPLLIWILARDNGDNTNFGAHFGALAMVLISGMFGQAQPVMLAFPYERPMFMREFSTGTCKLSSLLIFQIRMVFLAFTKYVSTVSTYY